MERVTFQLLRDTRIAYRRHEHQGDDRATVTVQVHAIWWNEQANLSGTAHPWRFQTRRDAGGWRVWAADLPPWCGVHVRADACH